MPRTYRYACPDCEHSIVREYRVPSLIRACESGCGFDHYVREELLAKVGEVPEPARPDDWDRLTQSERLLVAVKEGLLSLPDLR